jgi:SAM-dependent methyltransferase
VKRSNELELMDLAENDPALLAEDLRNLRILNRYLRGSRSVLLAFQRALVDASMKHFSVLDVGTGSADIPAGILAWAKRRGVLAKIVGLEAQALTARIAANHTRRFAEITVVRGDAGAAPFLPKTFDFVVASQFLHHFSEAKMVELLQHWAKLARRAIVVSDLVRHPAAYQGIRLLTRLATRNIMTRKDAPLSVRRALTVDEWQALFRRAALGPVEVFSVFPYRIAAVVSLGAR